MGVLQSLKVEWYHYSKSQLSHLKHNLNVSDLQTNTRSGKGKKCFSCDQDGHFSGDRKCPVLDRDCRMCSVIDHFRVKCPQARQRGGGGSRSRRDIGSNGSDDGRRYTGSRRGDSRGRSDRGCRS